MKGKYVNNASIEKVGGNKRSLVTHAYTHTQRYFNILSAFD